MPRNTKADLHKDCREVNPLLLTPWQVIEYMICSTEE